MKQSWKIAIFVSIIHLHAFAAEVTLQQALEMSRNYWTARLGQPQLEAETASKLSKSTFLPNAEGSFTVDKVYLVSPSQKTQGNATATLDQKLFDISAWKTTGARNADLISAACQTEADQVSVYQNVVINFFNVLSNNDEDGLQIKRSSMIQKAISLLKETTRLKLSNQADLYSAQSQSYQIDIDRMQVVANKTLSLNLLRGQLGISPKETIALDGKFIEQDADLTNWSEWSENIPSVLALKAKVAAATRDISAIQWEAFPAIDGTVVYSDPLVGRVSDPVTGLPLTSDSLSVLGTIRIPVFNQTSRRIRAKEQKRLLAIFDALMQTEKNKIANDIATLIVQLKADKTALEQAAKQMDISAKAYKDAWILLSLGKFDFLNVQNAQDVAINAERQWLQIKRRLDSTNANLQILMNSSNHVENSKFGCKNLSET